MSDKDRISLFRPKLFLCIGCSFTSMFGGWPVSLSAMLPDVEIYNSGKGGSGTYYHVWFSQFFVPARPHLVILQIIENRRTPETAYEKSMLSQMWSSNMAKGRFIAQELTKIIFARIYSTPKDEINLDLYWLRILRSVYDCPFVVFISKGRHTYPGYLDNQIKEIKPIFSKDIFITMPAFDKDKYRRPKPDPHPSALRQKIEARLLLGAVSKYL